MKNSVKGPLLTLFGGACWGLSGSVGQYLFTAEGMDSRWLVPVRLGLAGIILLVFSLIRYGKKTFAPWQHRKSALRLVLYGLAGVSFCQFFYFTTIQLSTAAIATILQSLSPIIILFAACLIAKRRPTGIEILATLLALAGVFLISTHGDPTHLKIAPLALLTGFLCAFCVMIYNVSAGSLTTDHPVAVIQGWSFLMGSIFFLLVFRAWEFHYVPSPIGWLGIACVVLVGNVIAFVAYITGVALIGPEKGILYGFSEPVSAALISAVFMHTRFTVFDALGFALVFVTLVLISRPKRRATEESA